MFLGETCLGLFKHESIVNFQYFYKSILEASLQRVCKCVLFYQNLIKV